MRVHEYDDTVEAALSAAGASSVYLILRIQDTIERRVVVEDGRVGRDRIIRTAGLGAHAFTHDGSIGFASVDDLTPSAARDAVERAARLAASARNYGGARTDAHRRIGPAVTHPPPTSDSRPRIAPLMAGRAIAATLTGAQAALADIDVGTNRMVRTTYHAVDEQWRIVRSDGTDVSYSTARAQVRHDLSGRIDGRAIRAAATVASDSASVPLSAVAVARLGLRIQLAAQHARSAAGAPPPKSGSYRLILNHAVAKGLAHEAIGHLCEADVDGSVLMRGGRLRLGQPLARPTVSVIDGPLPGDYVQQPVSANGIPRQTVRLIERGMLMNGLGDLFSAEQAGIAVTGACRASSFRDRPTPRMSNIRLELSDPLALDTDHECLTPDAVLYAVRRHGLLEHGFPTLYLAGYRGGQAHPRRGDFVFGVDAAYDLSNGGVPFGPASFSGLAERALRAIIAGIGPMQTDAIGACNKDGSAVASSGGSHALLVLDPDPDLIVSAPA